jgi:hypothetical protein
MFHGQTLPKKLQVVIDHPHCLTTEEMAKNQGAIMNASGSRYPLKYYKYVKGNILKFPFKNNVQTLDNIKDIPYKKRLMDIIYDKSYSNKSLKNINYDAFDFIINKRTNKTRTMNTKRGIQMINYYKSTSNTDKQPTAKQFLSWIKTKPFTLMTTRIKIIS